jgi:hypothetical protein
MHDDAELQVHERLVVVVAHAAPDGRPPVAARILHKADARGEVVAIVRRTTKASGLFRTRSLCSLRV